MTKNWQNETNLKKKNPEIPQQGKKKNPEDRKSSSLKKIKKIIAQNQTNHWACGKNK